jgi:ABC-type sugar transport system ATPase subunit
MSLVELHGVGKRFDAVVALHGVDLRVEAGRTLALVGENGAGKSTLGKIIAGVYRPDAGALSVDGERVSGWTPRRARRHGIVAMQQELAIVPDRTVIENVFLGALPNRWSVRDERAMGRRYDELSEKVGFALRAAARAGSLPIADQQKVEILRALAADARLIVMDEPTAALNSEESAQLLAIIRQLQAREVAIVFVSHFLDEVLAVADTIAILRDGAIVGHAEPGSTDPAQLTELMLGRPVEIAFPEKSPPPAPHDAPVLEVADLHVPGVVDGAAFRVGAGEIVGLAGLDGSDTTETAMAIYGAVDQVRGNVTVDGRPLRLGSPRASTKAGVVLIPPSRKENGLHLDRSIAENIVLPQLRTVASSGFVRSRRADELARGLINRLSIRPANPHAIVRGLSGGNQQKVMFAKWLARAPRVMLVCEPTRGVDVGAKVAIYELLTSLAAQGTAVVVVSGEHEEVVGLAHRVYVMRRGRIVDELTSERLTFDEVGRVALAPEAEEEAAPR